MSELKMRDALITAREFLVLEGYAEDNLAVVKIDEALAQPSALSEQMREALELADAALSGANMNMNVVERKVKAALAQQPAAVVKIPDQLYDSYAVFKRAEASCPSLQGHQVRHVLDAVVALIREANQEKGHAE